uniref:Uncharacterized protein n=1 Tax=Plectus sambesii TaxID=2011161 RepID=A0A914VHL6_9BILA
MAGSNAWSWVEDNNLEKASSSFSSTSRGQSSRKHGIERSSSFHALPHSRSAANLTGSGSSHSHRPSASPTPGPRRQHTERARHPSDERRVRRTSSLTLKHQKQHKNSVAGSQPSPSVVAPPPIGAERKKSRVDSLRLAGRSLLKKATDILAISGQQD